jgi:hypothetical protein
MRRSVALSVKGAPNETIPAIPHISSSHFGC